ncbi:uncharacterized protein LOC106093991 [Stomoxys calcitrans]|uniref:uncharacterized protein LOC106093991 n=1 Tax=Stomoxys calcitrans TaxID=35570 RepID=UPI0027E3ADAF|nr:uncharacterized protein LOC106093991 [Stomoxys calcitrans]
MNELKSLTKIGVSIGCFTLISGICNIILIYDRVARLMEYFKIYFHFDKQTIVGFIHYFILVSISGVMIFGIFKRRLRWLILWLVLHGISFIAYIGIITVDLAPRPFSSYELIQAIRVANESIMSLFCIYIVYRKIRSVNNKRLEEVKTAEVKSCKEQFTEVASNEKDDDISNPASEYDNV